MYVLIVLVLIFVAVFASVFTQGLWSNTLTLVNVLTAALVATNYFEPLADFFDRQESSYSYVYDFLALWLIFGVTALVLRVFTDYMSKVKVRFFMPLEKAGGIFMALWVSWIVVCFATMTLHTAPLARNFLGGGFQPEPNSKMLFGLAPDRVWLGWMHRESKGTLSRFDRMAAFDHNGSFILRYGDRRANFEKQFTLSVPGGGAAAAAPEAK